MECECLQVVLLFPVLYHSSGPGTVVCEVSLAGIGSALSS